MANLGIKVQGTEGDDKYRLYYPGSSSNGKSNYERLYYVGEYNGLSGYDILTIDWGVNNAQTWNVAGSDGNYTVVLNGSLGTYTDLVVRNVEEIRFANGSWFAPASKTYSITTTASAINEGSTLTTTVSTTNVNAGTTLYYALSGNGITSADFSAGSLLGSGVVSSSGSFSFSHTLANDLTTEGTETLDIKLFSDSNRSTQVGSTASVSIRDTSTTPVPTYSLSTSTNALGEGESFSTTVSTTNVAAGTSLFYALSGTGITAADFTAGGLSGSGTVGSDGKFSFSKTLANDLTTEGTETLTVRLYTDNNLSQQVGNAPSITIYDTSTTPQAAININGNNNGIINTGTINNSGTINTGTINTNSGNTTNITNNNIDKSKTITIAPTTINNITNNITNNISVNAVIANTSAPTYNVSNTYAKNLVGDVLTGSAQLNQNSYDAKFYNLGGGRYGVQQKGKSTIDEITGATSLQFQDQAISLASDVAATFNQVKGIDDVSGVVFRLYNAAFARLPDANGLENWINGNKSGGQTYASSALEFAKSQEFKNRYGSNVSDTQYVTTLYNNVLGRVPDAGGLVHYQGLLASGKDRGSLLLDFSESPENRALFTRVTGLS